ncbi:hypothetical protein HOC01_02815 [archaeon]|jgi:hypothetical protein|nr:hypothetical protein [archaeon]MBT6698178.1 hypothetical protein [archaeon]
MARKTLVTGLILCLIILISSIAVLAIPEFNALEGEVLYLSAETFDLDGDLVITTYPEPFDSTGRWITDHEDAGEYVVTILAEDSAGNEVSQDIILVVEDVNQEPYLLENSLTFEEGDEIDLREVLADPDNDVLDYSFSEPFDSEGVWQTGPLDAGRYVIEVTMDDGEFSLLREVEIVIEDVNVAPEILDIFEADGINFNLDEGEMIDLYVEAVDLDGDEISYSWYVDEEKVSIDASFDLNFDYESGDEVYTLALLISDLEHEQWLSWSVSVDDLNRAPEVDSITMNAAEGETISLDLLLIDLDGNGITYTFDQLFDENGQYTVGYEDAGEVEVLGFASDGELTTEFTVTILIEDTDRAPAIYGSTFYDANEGEVMEFILEGEDLDGDFVTFSVVSGLPDGAAFSSKGVFSWEVPYDAILRESNFVTDIFNSLRIENWFTSERSYDLRVKACGAIECSEATVELIISNVNLAPEFVTLGDLVVSETDIATIEVLASDLDNDVLTYYFSEPFDSTGSWETDFEDSGAYYITVTASDGYLTADETVEVIVEKTNRDPWFTLSKDDYTVLEGEEVKFFIEAKDLDNEDDLTITLVNGPDGSWFGDGTYSWVPSYDVIENKSTGFFSNVIGRSDVLTRYFGGDQETFWLEFMVTDGEAQVLMPVSVTVKNVNRAPQIDDLEPGFSDSFAIGFDDAIDFSVDAIDLDGDELTYAWKFSGFDLNKIEGPSSISRVFSSSGTKKVSVRVCDGRNCVMQEWTLEVIGDEVIVEESNTDSSNTVEVVETIVYVDSDSAPTYGMYVVEDWKD